MNYSDLAVEHGKGVVEEIWKPKEEYQKTGYQAAIRMPDGERAYILPPGYNDILDALWGTIQHQMGYDWGTLIKSGWRLSFDYIMVEGRRIVTTYYDVEPPENEPCPPDLKRYLMYFRKNRYGDLGEEDPSHPLYCPEAKAISPGGLEMAKLTLHHGVVEDFNFLHYSVSKKFYHVAIKLEDGTMAYILHPQDQCEMEKRWPEELTNEFWTQFSFIGWSIDVKTVDWRGYQCVVDWGNLRPPAGTEVPSKLSSYLNAKKWPDLEG